MTIVSLSARFEHLHTENKLRNNLFSSNKKWDLPVAKKSFASSLLLSVYTHLPIIVAQAVSVLTNYIVVLFIIQSPFYLIL